MCTEWMDEPFTIDAVLTEELVEVEARQFGGGAMY